MSTQIQAPKIYSNSIEETTDTNGKKKVFFKLFLINNKLSLPTDPYFIEWGATYPRALHEDVDTFIGTHITKKDKDGNHPSLRKAGIFEHNYPNKLDYIAAANKFYEGHSLAKIVDIYKPNEQTLQASEKDPNMMIQYDALAVTDKPEMIQMLNDAKNKNEDIYVSPGVFALDSFKNDKGAVIVKRFIGMHSSIVDHPAHTKALAFVKKQTCDVDHKTCYFKLLEASEVLNLNNNNSENKNMTTQTTATNVTVPSGNPVSSPDPNAVNVHTEVKDSKGKVTEIIDTNNQKKVDDIKKPEEVKAVEPTKPQETKEAKKEEEKDIEKMTKAEIIEYMTKIKQDTIKEVKAQLEQESKKIKRGEILNSFIASNDENLKADYEFYKNLPISADQLQKVLSDSKFNSEIQKAISSYKTPKSFPKPNDKPDQTYVAGASNTTTAAAVTSDRVKTSTYGSNNTLTAGAAHGNTRYIPSGKNIPRKFRH